MKKLLIGCMAAVAALIAFSGCDQDKVVYSGPNYLMFSDTLYTYAVQETMRYSMCLFLPLCLPTMTALLVSKS